MRVPLPKGLRVEQGAMERFITRSRNGWDCAVGEVRREKYDFLQRFLSHW